MALYGPSTATATVAANTNVVTIAGMDLTIVTPGMTINLGARDRKTGDAWIIASVALNGTSGGTVTTVGSIPTAYNSAAFVIDTTGYLGSDASYAANTNAALLATLLTLFGPSTNLYSGSRQLVFDKLASTAISRTGFAIAGRTWGDIAHRALTYTPSGGSQATIETLAVRAFTDGTTPIDALLFDLSNGTGDLRKGSATMASAATVDLGSAPMGKIAITGATTITSFGVGRHLERLVHIVDGGGLLKHNATSLLLPGRADIVTRAGDCFHATSDGSGNWRVRGYQRADGTPVSSRLSFRNRIRNGNFLINQRAVSGTVTLAAGAYGHDGFKAGASGCTYTFTKSGGVTTLNITAGTLLQVIEGATHLPEGGAYILSWTGTATARVYQGAASGTYAVSPVLASALSAAVNATVEFSTGTLALVQFEPGDTATPFEHRDDELVRCQRYYRAGQAVLFRANTAGAFSGGIMSVPIIGMRGGVTPTITAVNNGTGSYTGGVSFDMLGPTNLALWFSSAGAAGDFCVVNWTGSVEL